MLLEAGLVIIMTGAQRLNSVCQSILRVLLGNRINVMILEKALTLELAALKMLSITTNWSGPDVRPRAGR